VRKTNGHAKGDLTSCDVIGWARAHGAYRKALTEGRHAIRCPWHGEHTDDEDSPEDTSCVLWEPSGGAWPRFRCLHQHCDRRTIEDVLEAWGDADAHCTRIWTPPAPPALPAPPEGQPAFEGAPAEQAPTQRYRLLDVTDLHALPPMAWRIKNILPAEGVGCLFGPSGSGKSFLALDMMAALSSGAEWFGYRVKQCRVLCVVLEGESGFVNRVMAWERENECEFPESKFLLKQPFNLTDRDDVLALAAAVDSAGGADVTVIDTLNRAAPCCDENSSLDMGRILEGVRELQALIGGLVLLVAHTGKDTTKGLRGHSSLFAALDAAIEVARTNDLREWRAAKMKDAADGTAHRFNLRTVHLGEDSDGESITSCVIAMPRLACESTVQRAAVPTGGNQKIIYEALTPLFRTSHDFGKAGAPPVRPCLELEFAIQETRGRLAVEEKRRTERTREAITGLIARGALRCNEGWIWLP